MFTENTIRDVEVSEDSPISKALVAKLTDIEKNRIHSSDDLVLRKAVFGLLEIVAELEQRLIAVESPEVQVAWRERLAESLTSMTPDEVRLGERDVDDDGHHALTAARHESR
ncbi:hypothetical protein [Microbacterium sp.]|uniref:hypothetical protein n=1 Tax=Microbacterium sp. TaxID=51671 RepID=UPI002735B334|nr:hypothetical protein [Microbacterium sp.]MDP3950420.1 hypothetical protein [Microbacterium sp.]